MARRVKFILSFLLGLFVLLFVVLAVSENDQFSFTTAAIERGTVTRTVTTTGTVHAVESVEVSSQVSGRIEQVLVDFNDLVQQGLPIAYLDQQTFRAELAGAEATLHVANANVKIREAGVERAESMLASTQANMAVVQANAARAKAAYDDADKALQRKQSLLKKGLISDEALDKVGTTFAMAEADLHAAWAENKVQKHKITTAESELRQAQAELLNAEAQVPQKEAALKMAEVKLGHTIIRAPIDGVVISREIESGQTVAASLEAPKLFTIAQDLRQIEVYAKVDEADIGQVREGQSSIFSVDAFPNARFTGKVVQIRKSPKTSGNVVTYSVIISTENMDLLLLPGMTALVQIIIYESGDVLRVPNQALRFRPSSAIAHKPRNQPEDNGSSTGRPATVWVPATNVEPSPIAIRIGHSDAQFTELLSGNLVEGQEVVVGRRRDQ